MRWTAAPVNRGLCAAESGGVSLLVKGRGFTQATLVDKLQAVLDKVAGGIHLQKSEVGVEIPRRKSNDKKKRVTSYEERRLVVKNMENFYRKERWKCFSKWVSRLETGKNCKGQKGTR